ncbi:SIS domain-containing protein [Microbaculum marinum]|uniref:SIS domain-containing protein n=1 Tax=Microbaculum marinum TaxID=1764581 RepID=A0AAW9RZ13_9HYPH
MTIDKHIRSYADRLAKALQFDAMDQISPLAEALRDTWTSQRCVYLCGNGGSAANAIHLANDLIYGAGIANGKGLRVEALSANSAVLTCLGNDTGYENVFSEQIRVKGDPGDILIVLSGSGNSPNVVKALQTANSMGLKTFAVLGFSGGRCKALAQHAIHFPVDDMQIVEDLQLVVGHICMQWLHANPVGAADKTDAA